MIHQPNLRKLFTSQLFQIHNTNSDWVPTTLWCHWVWDLQIGNIRGKWKSFQCVDFVKLALAKLSICALGPLPTRRQRPGLHTRESHPLPDAVNYHWHWHAVVTQLCLLATPQPTRLLCPWDFPGKNTGVGSHFLLQAIFPIQGSNPSLLHW